MRFPNGVNRDRFNLITAVLAKHARLKVASQSLLVSVCITQPIFLLLSQLYKVESNLSNYITQDSFDDCL